jgi:hypothetical protein
VVQDTEKLLKYIKNRYPGLHAKNWRKPNKPYREKSKAACPANGLDLAKAIKQTSTNVHTEPMEKNFNILSVHDAQPMIVETTMRKSSSVSEVNDRRTDTHTSYSLNGESKRMVAALLDLQPYKYHAVGQGTFKDTKLVTEEKQLKTAIQTIPH